MENKIVTFDAADLAVTTNKLTVNRVNLSPSGICWTLGIDFSVSIPERQSQAGVYLMERHIVSANVSVSHEEIATAGNIAKEAIRNLTLAQTETLLTQVAISKLFPVLGLNPATIGA